MNRITNKEYLIDITIQELQTQQPAQPCKVRCEIHYGDDSFLRIKLQPVIRNGVANFCDERLRIPFSPEVSLVFKLLKPNKKEVFLGHYSMEIEKMLAQNVHHFKIKDRLEESDAYVQFECKIIDKQLLAQSDEEQPQVDQTHKSIATWMNKGNNKIKVSKPLSEFNSPFRIMKKTAANHLPLAPEDYGKLIREAEDIIKKRQFFNQRHDLLNLYNRDRHGNIQTQKILVLQERLKQARKEHFNINLVVYVVVSVIAFFIGLKL